MGGKKDVAAEITECGFEISDCLSECDSCSVSYPASVAKLEKSDDDGASLWKSTANYGLHLVLPTGKADWPHDAVPNSGAYAKAVGNWAGDYGSKIVGSPVKVTVSLLSCPGLERDSQYMDGAKGDVLILPLFVWVRGAAASEIGQVLSDVIPDLLALRDAGATELKTNEVEGHSNVSLEIDPAKSYIFLCSHRTRDKRCGITAPIMKKEMDFRLRELQLYRDSGDHTPGGVIVSFVNHIGGHKYAANTIIYLKDSGKNIWLARIKPKNAQPIIDECIVHNGKVWPNKVRLVQQFNPVAW